MDYSEEAYQFLLKMRAYGKKNYDEERYSQYIKYLRDLRDLDRTQSVLDKADYLRDIMDGKINDPEMTDTMYELHGYKMKEEADKFFEKFKQRICGSKGFWVPGH
jgi:hypothetical protein